MLLTISQLTSNRHKIYYYRHHNNIVDVTISLPTKHSKEAIESLRALETWLKVCPSTIQLAGERSVKMEAYLTVAIPNHHIDFVFSSRGFMD